MSLQRLVIDTGSLSADGFKSVCDLSPGQLPATVNLQNYLGSLCGGEQMARLTVNVGAVQAVGKLTSTGAATAAQACTICNVTFTARASDPAANEFVVSATPATQAANLAAAINASTDLAGKVTAVAVLGVVDIYSVVPGLLGNGLQLSAGNLSNVSATAFASGSDGTEYILDLR